MKKKTVYDKDDINTFKYDLDTYTERPVERIDQFCECIPNEQLDMYLTKKERKEFNKWINGQTVPIGGVYKWDLERFFKGLPALD
jgi:hypothetical protein